VIRDVLSSLFLLPQVGLPEFSPAARPRRSVASCWVFLLLALASWPTTVFSLEDGRRAGHLDLAGPWAILIGDSPGIENIDYDDSSWRQLDLPSTWLEIGAGEGDEVFWLRRRILLPDGWSRELAPTGLALELGPGRYGSYQVWAGGRPVGAWGEPGSVPFAVPRVFEIPREAVGERGILVLAIRFERIPWFSERISSYPPKSLPFESFALGDRQVLEARTELTELRELRRTRWLTVLALVLLLSGFSFLTISFLRRDLEGTLWLGIGSLLIAAAAAGGEATLLGDAGLSRRLTVSMVHLALPAILEFFRVFLGRPATRYLRALQIIHLLIGLVALVLPSLHWLIAAIELRWLLILPAPLLMCWWVAVEAWRGNSDARVLFVGTAAFGVTMAAETILVLFQLGTTYPLPYWTLVALILSVFFAVSQRTTHLRRELESMRFRLERMVEDRTAELSHSNSRLQNEISERQLAEEAMRMLERAVEQSIDGIAVANLSGQMQFINEAWARMHGYEVFELLGYELTIFHTEEQMQKEVEPLMARVSKEGSFEGEVGHRRRGGITFPAWMTATSLHDGDGAPIGYVFIARDITERLREDEDRQRLEARVRDAAKLESLGALAGGIAHDYNNILTGVLGNVSLASFEVPLDSPVRARLRQIEASAERAAELTDQLLAYAGQEEVTIRPGSLNEVIAEGQKLLEEGLPPGVKLEVHLRKDLPPSRLDPDQIRQAIGNLLVNAADSLSAEGGSVMLRTSMVNAKRSYFEGAVLDEGQPAGRYVFFEVSDTGRGMDEETRKRMFDPFFTTKETGRGLGLAAVLGIVRAHRGVIKVYSQEGRGTTIEVLLPAVEAQVSLPLDESGLVQAWKASGVALVVDDESLVRDIASRVLQRQGFEALMAESGEEALELFGARHREIRLILLDLTMPGMDGEEVARAILAIDPAACILLMSGYSEQSAMQGLAGGGVRGFLHKPFRPNELIRKVRSLIEG